MENAPFVLKSFGLSFLISSFLGALFGIVLDLIIPPNPNELYPTWIEMWIISAFAGGLISLLGSLTMIMNDQLDMKKLLIMSGWGALGTVVLVNIWFLI